MLPSNDVAIRFLLIIYGPFRYFWAKKITKSTVLFHKYTKSRNKKLENFAKFFFSKFCLFIYYLLIVDLSRCLIELLLSVILSRAKRRKWKMNFYFLKKSSFPAKVSRKVEICFFSAGHQILRKSRDRPFFCSKSGIQLFFVCCFMMIVYISIFW